MQSYIQTTEYTTAACALMCIINHFKQEFQLNKDNEFLIWRNSANLPVRASSIYGLALFAKKQGLNPSIVLGEKEYDYPDYMFKGYTKKDIDEAKYSSKLYYKEAMEQGMIVEAREFEFSEVKSLIVKGKIILLRINEGALRDAKSTSKYVAVHEYDDEKKEFSLMDPKQGLIKVQEELLNEAFVTLETQRKRDHRMIVF